MVEKVKICLLFLIKVGYNVHKQKLCAWRPKKNLPRLQSKGEFEGLVLNKAYNKRETLIWTGGWKLLMFRWKGL